jgi:hypothetical protein
MAAASRTVMVFRIFAICPCEYLLALFPYTASMFQTDGGAVK